MTGSGLHRLKLVLSTSTMEIIPLRNVGEQFAFLEPGQRVSVTASPTLGQDATIDVAAELAERSFEVVPHLSARLVRDDAHVEQIAARLWDARISRVFVVGGDGEAVGTLADGLGLLTALRSLEHRPTEIGVPGYPEGHPQISRTRLMTALLEKQAFADYITTQMCFDAAATIEWIDEIRAEGVTLPVHIGIPGAVSLGRLLSVSAKIGVGASLRFLSKHTGATSLVRRGSYIPDGLLSELLRVVEDPSADIRGFHIYTFDQVDATERWRKSYMADLGLRCDEAGKEVQA